MAYWYAWIGGPRLDGKPGSPEFMASYNRAVADRKAVPKDTLKSIVAKFRASADYTRLSSSSKRAYAAYLSAIELEFGDMPLAVLADPKIRGDFLEWRDGMSATPRKAVNRRRKVTPDRRPKLTPLVKGAGGSARPGGAGRGCAAGASAVR